MTAYELLEAAEHQLDEIAIYTRDVWGEDQAVRYVEGLFNCFADIATRQSPWRAIPAEFGVDGYFCRYEKHFIYWHAFDDGVIGIAAILHERMHLTGRLKSLFARG